MRLYYDIDTLRRPNQISKDIKPLVCREENIVTLLVVLINSDSVSPQPNPGITLFTLRSASNLTLTPHNCAWAYRCLVCMNAALIVFSPLARWIQDPTTRVEQPCCRCPLCKNCYILLQVQVFLAPHQVPVASVAFCTIGAMRSYGPSSEVTCCLYRLC